MPKIKKPGVSYWKLDPLQPPQMRFPNVGSLAGRIAPFFIPLLLSGFTTNVLLLLSAIFIAALWAQFSFLKLAKWIGVVACNWVFRKGQHQRLRMADSAKRKAEIAADRDQVRKGMVSIASAGFGLMLILGFGKASDIVFNRAFAGERDDVARHLEPTPAQASEDSVSSAQVTLHNGSGTNIRLLHFNCYARTMHLNNGMTFTRERFGHDLSGVLLFAGGSGQSLACTPNSLVTMIPAANTTCADITWWIDYVLVDQPTRGQRKPFRLILQDGHKRWEEVSLDSPALSCPGDRKAS
jgi:hypothetical protein